MKNISVIIPCYNSEKSIQEVVQGIIHETGGIFETQVILVYLCRELTGSASKIRLGKMPDPADDIKWIISCEKAEREAGFSPGYTLEQTIRWVSEEWLKI